MSYTLAVLIVDSLVASFVIYQCIMTNEVNISFYHSILWGNVYFLTRYLQAIFPKANQWITGSILSLGMIQTVTTILQFVGVSSSNHPLYVVTGTFNNPGPLGGFLAVCMVLSVSLLIECNKPIFKRMLLASTLLMGVGCILSDSRAAWAALMVACGYIAFKHIPQKVRKMAWTVLPVLVIGTAVVLYTYRPASADGRLLIWKVSTYMIEDSPLWGHGTNSFANHYMNYQGDYFQIGEHTEEETLLASENTLAFNEVVRMACEYGIIGLLLCFGIGVSLILASKQFDKVQWAAFSALIAYAVFACFSYPTEVPILKLTGTMLLAMAVPCCERTWFVGKKVRLAFLLLLTVYFGVLSMEYYREHRARKALVRYNVEEDEESEQELKEQYVYYKNNDRIMSLLAKMLFEKELYEESIPILTESIKLTPTGGKYMDMGTAYQDLGKIKEATGCFKKASHMLPGHILPVYNLFCIYREECNMPDSALWYAHRLVEMKIKKETEYTLDIRKEASDYLNKE